MDFNSGHGYFLIRGLILVGAGLLILSLIVNIRVAHSVRHDMRHRDNRNIFSQLGVILIGIGVSLFIFFFRRIIRTSANAKRSSSWLSPNWPRALLAAPPSSNTLANSMRCWMMAGPTSARNSVERMPRAPRSEARGTRQVTKVLRPATDTRNMGLQSRRKVVRPSSHPSGARSMTKVRCSPFRGQQPQ
ncbi:hypothetical protein [Mesorhizobium sp.]|uniref:hypothetical protein n=1 Tax=Mesorhizobium sp. TaxID=1871066 RepID=UPI0025803D83|nr:hypothetical protein [Mesorhizobium sp.]